MAGGAIWKAAAEPTFGLCQHLVYRGQVETARRLLDRFSDEQRSQVLTSIAGWPHGQWLLGD